MAFFRRKKKTARRRFDEPAEQAAVAGVAPRVGDLTVGDYANGMPNIRLAEMFKSFARQLPWLLILLAAGMLAAWHFTKDFKRTYTGEARILVQLGDEYVYQPVTGQGTQAAGLQLTADTIALNEVGIIKNPVIMKQVLGEMLSGPYASRFDPEGIEELKKAGNNTRDIQSARSELLLTMDKAFYVAPRPKSSIIDLAYKHEDPEIAVATLKALLLAYEDYRREIFVEGTVDIISERRRETEKQLGSNERSIARFLGNNGISDFDSEQEGVRERTEELRASLNTLRADISETEKALLTVENQLRGLPVEIDLYVDDRASQRIAQAELELKQLLAKYLPGSDPVRQKQTELNELKSLQTTNGGRAAGGRRVGPNPVYQELLTRRNTLQSTADSYREKEFTLQRQLDSADNKVRKLTNLSPQYQSLLREQETLDERLTTYNSREQEALINQQLAAANSENVKIISRPEFAVKGRNMRMIMFALATVAWGFTLFMIALLKVFLDPALYATPGPRRSAVAGVGGGYIPEPVTPAYDVNEPYYAPEMPAAQPAAAQHAPQEYQVPGGYDYAQQESAPYAQPQAYAEPQVYAQPQAYPDPYAAPLPDQAVPQYEAYTDGGAAIDVVQNPYLSGQVGAGAIDQPFQAPYPPGTTPQQG